jgi:hypothetical protein
VSSYGRNTFTRGAPCLCPVRRPLYTFAVATCRSAPHLRHRNSSRSRPERVVPLGTSRLGRLQPRAKVSSVRGTSGSCRPSAPKHNRPCLRYRRPAPSNRLLLHNKTHITRATLVFALNSTARTPSRSRSCVRTETVSLAGRGQSFRRSFSPTPSSAQTKLAQAGPSTHGERESEKPHHGHGRSS